MASIRYRVTGQFHGKQVTRRFRNTDEGRKSASAFAKTLVGPTTFYDVRARIAGREVTRTFTRRKDADAYAATPRRTSSAVSSSTPDVPRLHSASTRTTGL